MRFLKFDVDVIPDAQVRFTIPLSEASSVCKFVENVLAASHTTAALEALIKVAVGSLR